MEQIKASTVQSRLMEFVDQNDGPSAVAKRLGKHPQFLYNIRDGKSKPSYETLIDIWTAYPAKFDLMYVMTGQHSDQTYTPGTGPAAPPLPASQLEMENMLLKRENQSLRENNEMLRDVVSAQLGRDLKRSKTESANHTTQLFTLPPVAQRRFVNIDVRQARPAHSVFTGRRATGN